LTTKFFVYFVLRSDWFVVHDWLCLLSLRFVDNLFYYVQINYWKLTQHVYTCLKN
jgi:hypothetical protein